MSKIEQVIVVKEQDNTTYEIERVFASDKSIKEIIEDVVVTKNIIK